MSLFYVQDDLYTASAGRAGAVNVQDDLYTASAGRAGAVNVQDDLLYRERRTRRSGECPEYLYAVITQNEHRMSIQN